MFTGIVTDIGRLTSVKRQGDTRMVIETVLDTITLKNGASIACSGVCLTVVEKGADWFAVDVSDETLACTTLGAWKQGAQINLEKSLKIGQELGGHFVAGHVDAVGSVQAVQNVKDSHKVTIAMPKTIARYVAQKGSITVDGVSLTVNEVDDTSFTINIIPHTWKHTTFQYLKKGTKVNLEIDLLARYIARLTEVGE